MKIKKVSKFLLWSFVAVVVILAVLIGVLCSDIWDVEPPDVSDLMPEIVEIEAENNAYTYLKQVTKEVYWEENDENWEVIHEMFSGKSIDSKLCEKFIENNRTTIELIEKAVATDVCQFPKFDSIDLNDIIDIGKLIDCQRLLRLKTIYENSCGNYSAAFETNCLLLNYSECIRSAKRGNIIFWLASEVGTKWVYQGLSEHLHGVPKDNISKLIIELPTLESFEKSFASSMKGEFVYSLKIVEQILSGNYVSESEQFFSDLYNRSYFTLFKCNYLFQKNEFKKLRSDNLREIIEKSKKHSFSECVFPKKEELNVVELFGRLILPNSLGNILNDGLFLTGENLLKKFFVGKTGLISSHLVVSCELYKREHGDFPETLEKLVPEFIEEVPNDPFDGKPIRYNKEKGVLYSVGKNMIDSGGVGEKERSKMRGAQKRKYRDKEDLVFYLSK